MNPQYIKMRFWNISAYFISIINRILWPKDMFKISIWPYSIFAIYIIYRESKKKKKKNPMGVYTFDPPKSMNFVIDFLYRSNNITIAIYHLRESTSLWRAFGAANRQLNFRGRVPQSSLLYARNMKYLPARIHAFRRAAVPKYYNTEYTHINRCT